MIAGPTKLGHASVARRLTRWYRTNARDLPWRAPTVRSGYAALVSEAMLQQTQVARVVDAFVRFMAQFPTAAALAAAEEQDVLAAWTGLGYYRRARHLHAAAKTIVERHGGCVPSSAAELRLLPGVGRYTAGAIASIVHGERAAIVDGNVVRVLLRLRGEPLASDEPQAQRVAWTEAQALVDAATSPGILNEAMMELGATVCTPRSPRCEACPLRSDCAARRQGLTAEIPKPRRAARRMVVHHHAVVIRRGDRLLVERRGEKGLWAAMWQVPTVESDRLLSVATLRSRLQDVELPIVELRRAGAFVHLTTHREVRFIVHDAVTRVRRGRWVSIPAALEMPMSAPMRRILHRAAEPIADRSVNRSGRSPCSTRSAGRMSPESCGRRS